MSNTYENVRKLLARYILTRKVIKPDCILNPDRFKVQATSLQSEFKISQPDIGLAVKICNLPKFTIGLKKIAKITCDTPINVKLLRAEKVRYEPMLLSSEAELSIKKVCLGAQAKCILIPLKWQVSLKQKRIEKYRLKLVNFPPRLMPGPGKIHKFSPAFRRVFRVDLGLACRMPMYKKHVHLLDLEKKDLVRYWKLLLRKAPSREGKDIELLAVYRNIDVEQYSSFEFEGISSRLKLRPKLPSQRNYGEGRHCDIIFGRYKPLGTILTAVIGSD